MKTYFNTASLGPVLKQVNALRYFALTLLLLISCQSVNAFEPLNRAKEDLSKFQASHEFDDLVNYYTTCWAISYRGEEAQGIKGSERFMEAAAELTIEIRQTLIEKRGMTFEQVVDHVTMQSAKKKAEILENAAKLLPMKNGKPYDGRDCFYQGCLDDYISWNEGFEKALQYCIASLR